METAMDILLDTCLDCVRLLPFLFIAFLLIEALEHYSSEFTKKALEKVGKAGPVIGALCGCVPQCGFSVLAANLFAGGVISPGTLIAVFLSTSDEAVIILLGNPGYLKEIGALIAAKVIIAIAAGYITDLLLAGHLFEPKRQGELCEQEHCGCHDEGIHGGYDHRETHACLGAHDHQEEHAYPEAHDHREEHNHQETHVCLGAYDHREVHDYREANDHQEKHAYPEAHDHREEHNHQETHAYPEAHDHQIEYTHHGAAPHHHSGIGRHVLLPALRHTVRILIYLFIFILALNTVMELLGEETFSRLLLGNTIFQPFLSAMIGFIPNCAASVFITQLYLTGVLSFPAVIAGLCTGAGAGLLVLLRVNRHRKENIKIIVLMYVFAAVAGVILFFAGA